MAPAAIVPAPPLATGVGLPWDVEVDDAVAAITAARAEHGDTFLVGSGRDRYLFTFSATGVESFYALPEEAASKGVADYLMLRRKLPDAVFDGRRTLPGSLFRRGDVATYLAHLDAALDQTIAELGPAGTTDVFALTRRLAHRMGLASWAGPGCADGAAFDRLVAAFDALDGAESFVHPDAMAAVAASGKAREIAALDEVVSVVGAAVDRLDADADPDTGDGGGSGHDLFARIVAAWDEMPAAERRTGVAHDVALIHIASMSNLAAALGWLLVDLAEHPSTLSAVRDGEPGVVERCALESTRLAQRSIMARTVMAPVRLAVGDATYAVPPGVTIATLLPLLNTTATPGLETWRPERWERHRLIEVDALASPQLVTAFGHGRHSCPAQPFSLAAMGRAATRLLGAYDVHGEWAAHPEPVATQIGGVARADGPCPLTYARHADT